MQIISITGTKGKTTLVFLLDAILRTIGKKVLCINSEGVFQNGKLIKDNAYFLKKYRTSANVVAVKEIGKDEFKAYDYVVIESSFSNAKNLAASFAGGRVDIGVLTNVYSDHIDGAKIKDRDDLLRSKVDVLKNIKKGGAALIFAGDIKSSISYKAAVAVRAQRPDVRVMTYDGGKTNKRSMPSYCLQGDFIRYGTKKLLSYAELEMPFKYSHKPTAANVVALVAILHLLGIEPAMLTTMKSLGNLVPGRLNMFSQGGKTVVLDYAHEIQSLRAASKLLHKEFKGKRIIAVVRLSYYRNAKTIRKLTKQMAAIFDGFIVYDKAVSRVRLRKVFTQKLGMRPGEVAEIMEEVLLQKSVPVKKIAHELEAIKYGVSKLRKNELLYVIGDQIKKDIQVIKKNL